MAEPLDVFDAHWYYPDQDIAPILYHLADDPTHLRLITVCEQDILELASRMKHEPHPSPYVSLWQNCWKWRNRNRV